MVIKRRCTEASDFKTTAGFVVREHSSWPAGEYGSIAVISYLRVQVLH